jgi:hypothetical protein
MEMVVTLKCECGNLNKYEIKSEKGFEVSNSIHDSQFQAQSKASGVWVYCKKCKEAKLIR